MPSIIQSVSVTESTGPVTTIVMPSNVTAGNLLVVMIGNPGGGDLGATFADTQSSTFALQVNQTNVNGTQSSCDIWTAPINSSGPETITRTVSSSNYPVSIWVIEVDVPNPVVDSTNIGTADGGTGVTSGNVFTANSNVLLVGAASDNTGNAFDSASPSGSTTAFVSPNGAFLAKFVSSGTYACTFNKSSGGVRYSVVAALISGGNTESVSDSESLSDAVGQGRGYLFSEGISLSESAANDTTGAVPTSIEISGSDFISLIDSAAIGFGVQPPPHRGNIDYDQIRVSARSGDGAKLHTLTGSITTGHGVIFDANGNLVDSGSAPGGGGSVTSVDMTVPTGFAVSGNPITTSGTLAVSLSSQAANKFLAAPDGTSGTPTFRVVAAGDLPLGSSSAFGAVKVDNTTITAAAGVISTPTVPGVVLLEQHTASSSASLDFTTWYSSSYDDYEIRFTNIIPATDNVFIDIRCSTNGGSSYDSGNNYNIWKQYFYSGGSGIDSYAPTSGFHIVGSLSNGSNFGYCGNATISSPGSTAVKKMIQSLGHCMQPSSLFVRHESIGYYDSTTAVNAFQIIASSGNIASGIVRIYGRKK